MIHDDFWSKIELIPFKFWTQSVILPQGWDQLLCRHVYCRTVMVLFARSKTQHLDKLWSNKLTFVNDEWTLFCLFHITVFCLMKRTMSPLPSWIHTCADPFLDKRTLLQNSALSVHIQLLTLYLNVLSKVWHHCQCHPWARVVLGELGHTLMFQRFVHSLLSTEMLTTGDTVISLKVMSSPNLLSWRQSQWLHQVLQQQDVEDDCGPSIPSFSLDYEKVELIRSLCNFSIVHQWGNGAKHHIRLCRDSNRNYEDYQSSISPASNLFHQNQNNNRL